MHSEWQNRLVISHKKVHFIWIQMFRTNLHWYLKFCMMWCGTWTEKILHSHLHAWQPQVTAPSRTSSYTVVTQWPPLTCCGDQVNTHNTHCIKSCWSWLHYNYTLSLLLPGWKLLWKCSSVVSPLLAQVRGWDLEPDLASNLFCLQVPVLFSSFTDHLSFLLFQNTFYILCSRKHLRLQIKVVSVSLDI